MVPQPHTSFVFTNNIVCFDSGGLLGSDWSNDNYVMERNVCWDTRPGAAASLQFARAGWEQWQTRGHDTNSVIADPLFVAPEKFDLRLKPESPALKLGFKPIDLSTVGVRARTMRSSVSR